MIRINDIIFSLDIIEEKFSCDLKHCRGVCCRYGDSGAPLNEREAEILEKIWKEVKPFLRPEGVKAIIMQGKSIIDSDDDRVTPLIGSLDCAYSIISGGILMCGLEKAWSEGKTDFRKPVSCHLYPIRIKEFPGFTAINYEALAICSAGREKGSREGIYLYEFLKEPLLRIFGEEVYKELCEAAIHLRGKM